MNADDYHAINECQRMNIRAAELNISTSNMQIKTSYVNLAMALILLAVALINISLINRLKSLQPPPVTSSATK